jgi:hypothetical protein
VERWRGGEVERWRGGGGEMNTRGHTHTFEQTLEIGILADIQIIIDTKRRG